MHTKQTYQAQLRENKMLLKEERLYKTETEREFQCFEIERKKESLKQNSVIIHKP